MCYFLWCGNNTQVQSYTNNLALTLHTHQSTESPSLYLQCQGSLDVLVLIRIATFWDGQLSISTPPRHAMTFATATASLTAEVETK